MIKTLFILILSFLINIIDSQMFILAAQSQIPPLSVQHKIRIGGEKNEIIYRLMGITTDENENIYITDTMDYSVKKYNKKGNFLKKVGRRGSGPGEMLSPGNIFYYKGKIYITQQMHPGILVFNQNLDFKYQIPAKIPIYDIFVLNDKIFVSSSMIKSSSNIGSISKSGKINLEIGQQNKIDQKYQVSFLNKIKNFFIDKDQTFYTSSLFINKIEKYDHTFQLLKQLSFNDFVHQKTDDKNSSNKLPSKTFFKDICMDKQEFVFVLGGSYSKTPSQDIYILSKNLELITTITLKDPTHCIHISHNNFLYSRAEGGTAIDVYEINY